MTRTPLTVHNAEIRTATVEVKTLTLTGKQVTLAVFRQLREVPLHGEDRIFRGQPWGWVNYCPDKRCADLGTHRHVVWQSGSSLLRCTISRGYDATDVIGPEAPSRRDWLEAAVAGEVPLTNPDLLYRTLEVSVHGARLSIEVDRTVGRVLYPDSHLFNDRWLAADDPVVRENFRERALTDLRNQRGWKKVESFAELDLQLAGQVREVLVKRERWYADVWSHIESLPQLFIAV
jgi:hypothetical protein